MPTTRKNTTSYDRMKRPSDGGFSGSLSGRSFTAQVVDDYNRRLAGRRGPVETMHLDPTPQSWIAALRIGGTDAMRALFGFERREDTSTSYGPLIALFSIASLFTLAILWRGDEGLFAGHAAALFIAVSMVLLGLQKLRDVDGFVNTFLRYDLLAQRWLPYAYIYPFAEAGAGLAMMAGTLTWLAAPIMFFIGSIGLLSVLRAVYVEERDLNCACVGGDSNVPLGVVSLIENLVMVIAGLWMVISALAS